MSIIVKKIYQKHPFHLVDPSPWPFLVSMAAFTCAISAVLYFHLFKFGSLLLLISFLFLFFIMFVWWRDVSRESNLEGHHTGIVQQGLRYGILLFIVSEIFFLLLFFELFFIIAYLLPLKLELSDLLKEFMY